MLFLFYLLHICLSLDHGRILQANLQDLHTRFPCSRPRPSLVYVDELGGSNPELDFVPSAAILYRCGKEFGYCSNTTMSCRATEMADTRLLFATHNKLSNKLSYIYLNAVNHTACGCH